MKKIILFVALLSAFFVQAQEKYFEVKPNEYPIDKLTRIEYIGNGVATWIYGGELYQLTVDASNGISTKKIANSGINLQSMTGFDFTADGNKDLFVSRSSSYGDGVLRYRFEDGEFYSAGNQNYIESSYLQHIGDFDNDGDDDCIYNNYVLVLKDDSEFGVFGKAHSSISQIESPVFFDADEDGDNDVLFTNSMVYSILKIKRLSILELFLFFLILDIDGSKKLKLKMERKYCFREMILFMNLSKMEKYSIR